VSTSDPSGILLKVGASLLAAFAGASAGVTLMLVFGWEDWRVCLTLIGVFAVPVWMLVLLPLHVLLPQSSSFWRPGISAGVGGAVGAVLLAIYFLFVSPGLLWLFLPIGVLVGTVAGLVGSAITRFYAARSA
jgi:hypothetical protein